MIRTLILVPIVLVVVAVFLIVLTACKSSSTPSSTAPATRTPSLTDLLGDWKLSKLEGQDVTSMLPAQARPPSLSFNGDGKVTGYTGVNQLSSSLDLTSLTRGQFKLGPAITTRMAGPAESMAVENKFTTALQRVTNAKVSNNSLTLTDGAQELLSFVR